MFKRIRQWWREQLFWKRFTQGKCVKCGKYDAATGSAMCGLCLSQMLAKGEY